MIQSFLFKKQTPRVLVFIFDVFFAIIAISSAFLLRFNFSVAAIADSGFVTSLFFVVTVRAISFIVSRIYAGLIRYTSTKDIIRVLTVTLSGSVFFLLANYVNINMGTGKTLLPFSIVGIDFFVLTFLITSSRIVIKTLYHTTEKSFANKTNVAIYGADEFGFTTKITIDREAGSSFRVVAFFDEAAHSGVATKLDGVRIYPNAQIEDVLTKQEVSVLIFAKRNTAPAQKQKIIDICLNLNIKVHNVPEVNNWINGELSFKQIREIKIEDLLERPPIKLNKKQIQIDIYNNTVLVTGAAGSIGSEIVRQVVGFSPKRLIVFDQAESPLYDIELELSEKYKTQVPVDIVIGSIRNRERLEEVFERYKPNIVFHAAAYKHVPMMENHPEEAIRTNVLGTKNVADLAVKYGCRKFVMVSTDKAVNPTNVMGASKRIAEIYTQSLNKTGNTAFITTRFGNVLGSNGSVIPRFKRQIETGGPVTVTHPDITRYFMTIPEACQLVLEAGTMGKGGEIFIFDMGKSVKIVDLAKKMVKLSGLTFGRDIRLIYTGLRPGEKLYEELLNSTENTIPTYHERIMIAKVQQYDAHVVTQMVDRFVEILHEQDAMKIVQHMKNIVPEFRSKNSIYEILDSDIPDEELPTQPPTSEVQVS